MAGRRLAAVCFSVRPNIRHARYRTVRDSFDSSMAETSLAILCTSRPLALALPPEALPRPNLIQMRVPLAPLSPPPKECPEASRRRLLQASKPHRCQAPEETSENPAPMAKEREREHLDQLATPTEFSDSWTRRAKTTSTIAYIIAYTITFLHRTCRLR